MQGRGWGWSLDMGVGLHGEQGLNFSLKRFLTENVLEKETLI